MNLLTNFGWEYVWHCHLLGHEENDMMRPLIIQVPPETPTSVTAQRNPDKSVTLTWSNAAASASGFAVQRSSDPLFATNTSLFIVAAPSVAASSQLAVGSMSTFTDSSGNPTVPTYYRVAASKLFNNQVVSNGVLYSAWSNPMTVAPLPAPFAALTPGTLNFGLQLVKTSSPTQTLTLSNSGTAPFNITSAPVITGPFASSFSVVNNCGASVSVSGSCTMAVAFTPTVASSPFGMSAVLNVGTSDTLHPTLNVALTGSGTALGIKPTSLSFGNVVVGKSATQTISLTTASGSAIPLTGTGILLTQSSGDYVVTNNCTNNRIPVAGCTLTVKFSPASTGTKPATITISTTDLAGLRTIALSGAGVAPQLVVSPTTLSFSANAGATSAAQTVVVSNTGTSVLTINSIGVPGTAFTSTISSGAGACPITASTLQAGSSCTVSVVFSPGAKQTGTLAGSININIPAADGASQSVSLSGLVTVPVPSVNPISLSFLRANGSKAQTALLTNTGNGPLSISSIAVSGATPQFTQTNTCPASLAPSATCTVSVIYAPRSTGAKSANLVFNFASPIPNLLIPLSGN